MIAFFDPVSGISGDMALGALLDAGLARDQLEAMLATLPLSGWRLAVEQTGSHSLVGTRVKVLVNEGAQPHRHLSDVVDIITGAELPLSVQERATAVFNLLAEAEAKVHGTTPDQVHFHEVGAVDSIVDIVGTIAGLYLLGVEQAYCGPLPLPLRGGIGRSAHGPIPLPGPATLEILSAAGAPFISRDTDRELVTPTGAALVAALCRFEQPPLRLRRVGVGYGTRELAWPNILRVLLCDIPAAPFDLDTYAVQRELARDRVMLFETNIDDLNPQVYGYLTERLLAAGALDAWLTPVQMKKGRPGTVLAALAAEAQAGAIADLMLAETGTLGLRCTPVERIKAQRRMLEVETSVGMITVKARLLNGRWTAEPEYEDCAAAARASGMPLREVMHLAAAAARRALADEG